MNWSEITFLDLLAGLGIFLTRLAVDRLVESQSRGPLTGPTLESPPDDWRCPDASEIARIMGAPPEARVANLSSSMWDGHDSGQARASLRPLSLTWHHPMWDRELDG